MKTCTTCKGSGVKIREAFTYEGKTYPETRTKCASCFGAGKFGEPNFKDILDLILAKQGKNKGKLRTSRPAHAPTILACRAYYVWRMARFHGGADVTMPITASFFVRGDPYYEMLDAMADAVACASFGTDLAAAHRWGRALGKIPSDLPGLPASAYEGGPVQDGNKPEEEAAELL
jgi:hypothetical protein